MINITKKEDFLLVDFKIRKKIIFIASFQQELLQYYNGLNFLFVYKFNNSLDLELVPCLFVTGTENLYKRSKIIQEIKKKLIYKVKTKLIKDIKYDHTKEIIVSVIYNSSTNNEKEYLLKIGHINFSELDRKNLSYFNLCVGNFIYAHDYPICIQDLSIFQDLQYHKNFEIIRNLVMSLNYLKNICNQKICMLSVINEIEYNILISTYKNCLKLNSRIELFNEYDINNEIAIYVNTGIDTFALTISHNITVDFCDKLKEINFNFKIL